MSRIGRRRFIKASGTAGLIGVSGVSGCLGNITGGGGTPTLRLGWIAPTGFPSPFEVPELQEELDNLGEDYEVELSRNQSTPDGLNKLAAGELDTTTAAYSSFPGAVNNDIAETDLAVVGTVGYDAHPDWFSIPWLALTESGIEAPEDLEGGKVGVNALGTGVHAIAAKVFADVGMTEGEDFEYVEIPFPAMEAAIEEGRVDAGTNSAALAAAIRSNLDVTTVFDGRTAFGETYPFSFNVTTAGRIEENQDAFEAWGSDYVQLLNYMIDNREELVPVMASHFDLPEGLVDAFWLREGRDWYIPDDAHVDGQALQSVIDELPDLGFIESAPDIEPLIRNDLLG